MSQGPFKKEDDVWGQKSPITSFIQYLFIRTITRRLNVVEPWKGFLMDLWDFLMWLILGKVKVCACLLVFS